MSREDGSSDSDHEKQQRQKDWDISNSAANTENAQSLKDAGNKNFQDGKFEEVRKTKLIDFALLHHLRAGCGSLHESDIV
jgi:hypothetical protein